MSRKTCHHFTEEQRELMGLRRRNKGLELQLDLLKQAAVIVA